MWKSQESERRLRDPIEGKRDQIDVVSSSPPAEPPPRANFPVTGAPVKRLGLAKRILGGTGAGEGLC